MSKYNTDHKITKQEHPKEAYNYLNIKQEHLQEAYNI